MNLLLRRSETARHLAWRLGRKLYTAARGEGRNDPRINGEYWLIDQALALAGAPHVLLDIGANRGDWTGYALRRGTKSVRVHAFEPSRATRAMLGDRFAGTPLVEIHALALSDRSGLASFHSGSDGAGTNSLSPISGPNTETVALTTLDGFLADIGVTSVTLAKIDTEGFDLSVLTGAAQALLAGRIEVVQFEYNWRWLLNHACLRDVFELIADKPYRLGRLTSRGVEFFDAWHFELDRFFESNYVLVHLDSELCRLGTSISFDATNVGIRS